MLHPWAILPSISTGLKNTAITCMLPRALSSMWWCWEVELKKWSLSGGWHTVTVSQPLHLGPHAPQCHHLPTIHQIMNPSGDECVDEVRAFVIQSLPKSPISEHSCSEHQAFNTGALGDTSYPSCNTWNQKMAGLQADTLIVVSPQQWHYDCSLFFFFPF